MSDEQNAMALILAREWQQAIAALALDTTECLEIVKEIELKPGLTGHPFYWGKMSLLTTFRELADADVKRFETPGAVALLAELDAAREIVAIARRGFGTDEDIRRAHAFDPVRLTACIRAYDAVVKGGKE